MFLESQFLPQRVYQRQRNPQSSYLARVPTNTFDGKSIAVRNGIRNQMQLLSIQFDVLFSCETKFLKPFADGLALSTRIFHDSTRGSLLQFSP